RAFKSRIYLHNAEAHYAWEHGEHIESKNHSLEALKFAQLAKDELLQSEIYMHLGIAETCEGNPKAILSYKSALHIFPSHLLDDTHPKKPTRQVIAKRIYTQIPRCLAVTS